LIEFRESHIANRILIFFPFFDFGTDYGEGDTVYTGLPARSVDKNKGDMVQDGMVWHGWLGYNYGLAWFWLHETVLSANCIIRKSTTEHTSQNHSQY
jgi:hypothetical protein